MAQYNRATTWITNQILTATALNAEFDAVRTSLNSINNTQIASNANIAYSKLAGNAIVSTPQSDYEQIINAYDADQPALTLKAGAASPTVAILRLQTSAGVDVFSYSYNHYLKFGSDTIYVRRNGDDLLFRDNNQSEVSLSTLAAAAGTDEKSKVSSNDTTAGYLNGKLVAGAHIALTEVNDAGNETLSIAVTTIAATTGASDASKAIKTDTNGYLDPTFLGTTMTIAGVKTWSGNQLFNAVVNIATASNWQLAGTGYNGTMGNLNTLIAGTTSDADALHAHNRVIIPVTSGEAYSIGDALYIKNSDGKAYKTDSDAVESTFGFIGFALDAASAADQTHYVLPIGSLVEGLTLTAGNEYVPGATAGAVVDSASAGTYAMRYLMALTSTTGLIMPSPKIAFGTGTLTFPTNSAGSAVVITCGFRPKMIFAINDLQIDVSSGANWKRASIGFAFVYASSIVQSCLGGSPSTTNAITPGDLSRWNGYIAYETAGAGEAVRAYISAITDTSFSIIPSGVSQSGDTNGEWSWLAIG